MRRSNLEFHFCADRDGLRQQARLGVGRGARSEELIGWPQYVAHPEHVIAQAERKKIRDRVIIQFNRAARNVGEHGPRVASGVRRRCENPAAACRCARRDDGRRRRSGRRARGDGERYPGELKYCRRCGRAGDGRGRASAYRQGFEVGADGNLRVTPKSTSAHPAGSHHRPRIADR